MKYKSMNFFQYMFSDKNGKAFWIFYYFVLIIIFLLNYAIDLSSKKTIEITETNNLFPIFNFLIILILISAFPLFNIYSFSKYREQQRFLEYYSKKIKENSIRKVNVEIIQGSYKMTAIRTSYFATVNPAPKNDIFIIAEIEDNLAILGQAYTFGVFKEHLTPIILILGEDRKHVYYQFAKIANKYKISEVDNNLVIDFENPIFDIKKLVINDWKN